MSPWLSYLIALGKFPSYGARRLKPSKTQQNSWVVDMKLRLERPGQLESANQSTRQKRGLKFELWRSAEGPLSIQLSTIHTYIWRNYTGKEHPKNRNNILTHSLTQGWEWCLFPWARMENRIKIYWALGRVCKMVFFQYWIIISPRLSIALLLLLLLLSCFSHVQLCGSP